jgi:hypothetical protein
VRVFLSRWSGGRALSIARADDGSLHLVVGPASVACHRSLDALLRQARRWLPDGADLRAGWCHATAPLLGPVCDYVNGERRTTAIGAGNPAGAERRQRSAADQN